MHQRCEVCETFRPEGSVAGQKVVEVPFEARTVVLCTGHARIAENSGVTSFEALRELYGSGRRSFVPRRGRSLATQGGERRGGGRRASDRDGVVSR